MTTRNRLTGVEGEGVGRTQRDQPKNIHAHKHSPCTQPAVWRRLGGRGAGWSGPKAENMGDICNSVNNQKITFKKFYKKEVKASYTAHFIKNVGNNFFLKKNCDLQNILKLHQAGLSC